MAKARVKKLPVRDKVKTDDTWDLSSLFTSDTAWEKAFKKWEKMIGGYEQYRGKLASDAKTLGACLKLDLDVDRAAERLGTYAFLKTTQDQANSDYQRMMGRLQNVGSRAAQAASYIRPEVLAIPSKTLKKFLASKHVAPHRLTLERLRRYKKHTLSKSEERLLAMQSEMSQAAGQAFRQLNDADMSFGTVTNEKGERVELTHASFSALLHSPKRTVRRNAFQQFYKQFDDHKNTLAATLSGSIQRDIYYAKARNYPSALESALYADDVPLSVYDNLIDSVGRNLPSLHRYYDLRRRKMRLRDIHIYDTYVPILTDLERRHTWKQAVKVIMDSLTPLGSEYCSVLEKGLTSKRWCDRYENQGKQSGAFSAGSFDGAPYILMNYQANVLDHVFTLAHEAGHSMHSYYSSKHQPFEYYSYVIFVAEVASTFNEQLLSRHMMDRARDDRERAYLINRDIDAIRGTIIRQTMFAEFEKITHAQAEAGEPLTVDSFRSIYSELIQKYFGPEFTIDDELSLECFRIPHFYRAFYVYKYATGLSAAITLSKRVLDGGKQELGDYLSFLKGGCSKYPLDLLRDAGVDMEKPNTVDTALAHFDALVKELDELL